jgi:hypothetical protein
VAVLRRAAVIRRYFVLDSLLNIGSLNIGSLNIGSLNVGSLNVGSRNDSGQSCATAASFDNAAGGQWKL